MKRYTGCLLGLAVGDALGAPLEGLKSGHIFQLAGEVVDYTDSLALFPDRPGKWRLRALYTDDTQQALAVADMLAVYGAVAPGVLRDTYIRLADEGPAEAAFGAHRGTGYFFRRAVDAMRHAADPRTAGQPSAGNGAAMRIAPIGLWYADDEAALVRAAIEVSLLTHHDPRAIAAAVAIASAVAALINAASPADIAQALPETVRNAENILATEYAHFQTIDAARVYRHTFSDCLRVLPFLLREHNDDLTEKTLLHQANEAGPTEKITHSQVGFAPASVVAALYRALEAPDFLNPMLRVINAGGDTDTVAAIVGALCGARFGEDAIPEHWRHDLINARQICVRAMALHDKEIDWSAWEDLVEMEKALTQREIDTLARGLDAHRKEIDKKHQADARRRARKAEAAPPPDPGFAPPPEIWLRDRPTPSQMEPDLDPIQAARERARRGRKRIEWKEERRRKQRDREDDGDE